VTCESCGGKTDLYLCSICVAQLRDTLASLPFWLDALADAAIGQTRMGDGGRGSSRREPFKGEDEVLPKCVCGHAESAHGRPADQRECYEVLDDDKECACWEYRPAVNQAKLRAQLLAEGRVNARASDRLDAVRNCLTTWVRHIADSRGIVFVRVTFIGPLPTGHVRMAATTPALITFLRTHVQSIACDEAAGELLGDLAGHVRAIEKIVNRPDRHVWLGACPTWHESTRRNCGTPLWAREDAIEVRCDRCRTTHACDRLKLMLFSDLEREKVPWANILRANKSQPEDRQIPERTLQSWRRMGRLMPRGYRRASNGREVINRHSEDDEPLYLWSDIRRLRDAKPQKKPTGAAARK
jgi:hypothetical protein